MRLEIIDTNGRPHGIDTSDTEILAKWLVERLSVINPSYVFPSTIRIWPETNEFGQSDWPGESRIEHHSVIDVDSLIQVLRNSVTRKEQLENDCS